MERGTAAAMKLSGMRIADGCGDLALYSILREIGCDRIRILCAWPVHGLRSWSDAQANRRQGEDSGNFRQGWRLAIRFTVDSPPPGGPYPP